MNLCRCGTACQHGATPTSCALLYAHTGWSLPWTSETYSIRASRHSRIWPFIPVSLPCPIPRLRASGGPQDPGPGIWSGALKGITAEPLSKRLQVEHL